MLSNYSESFISEADLKESLILAISRRELPWSQQAKGRSSKSLNIKPSSLLLKYGKVLNLKKMRICFQSSFKFTLIISDLIYIFSRKTYKTRR